MDKKLTIVTGTGYTKEEAAAAAGFKLESKFDATLAWKKDGKPEGVDLATFAGEYISDKVKDAVGVGFVITVESGQRDTRERPYKVENVVTKGQRKFKQVYEGYINYSDTEEGTLVLVKDSKQEAEDAAKDYVKAHKTNVMVRVKKRVIEGQKNALIVTYEPSAGTRLGTYIFFGLEN